MQSAMITPMTRAILISSDNCQGHGLLALPVEETSSLCFVDRTESLLLYTTSTVYNKDFRLRFNDERNVDVLYMRRFSFLHETACFQYERSGSWSMDNIAFYFLFGKTQPSCRDRRYTKVRLSATITPVTWAPAGAKSFALHRELSCPPSHRLLYSIAWHALQRGRCR